MNINDLIRQLPGTELAIGNHSPYILDADATIKTVDGDMALFIVVKFRNFDVEYDIEYNVIDDRLPEWYNNDIEAHAIDEIMRGILLEMRAAIDPESARDEFHRRINDIAKDL